jgi:tape measure domain-containing protein
MDIANLLIKADSSQVKTATKALDDLGKKANETQVKNKKLKDSQSELNNIFSKTIPTVKNLIGSYIGIQGIKSLGRLSDTYTNIENRLKLVTSSTQELAMVQNQLTRVSDETFTSLSSNATLFNRLAVSTREFGYSQQDVIKATQALQQTFRISGTTTAEAANSAVQFAQGLAAGALRGDEFRSVAEQNTRLMQLLSQGLGVSTGKLKEMADEGLLKTQELMPVLINSLAQLNKEAEDLAPAFEQTISKIIEKFGLGLDSAFRMSKGFKDIGDAMRELIPIAQAVGAAIGTFIGIYASTLNVISGQILQISRSLGLAPSRAKSGSFDDLSQVDREMKIYDNLLNKQNKFQKLLGMDKGTKIRIESLKQERKEILKNITLTEDQFGPFQVFGPIVSDEKLKEINKAAFLPRKKPQIPDEYFAKKSEAAEKALGETMKKPQSDFNSSVNEAESAINGILSPLESYRIALSNIEKMQKSGALAQASSSLGLTETQAKTRLMSQATKQLADDQEELKNKLKENQTELQKYAIAAQDTQKSIMDFAFNGVKSLEDNLVDLVRGTKSVSDAFKDMADSIISDLIRMQVKKSITGPLSAGIDEIISSGGSSGILSGIGGALGFASGGSFKVGGVGGPDSQLVPLRLTPGEVVNVKKGGQGGGMGVPNITIINNNAGQSQVGTGVSPNGKDIEIVIDQVVAKNINNPASSSYQAIRNFGAGRMSRG